MPSPLRRHRVDVHVDERIGTDPTMHCAWRDRQPWIGQDLDHVLAQEQQVEERAIRCQLIIQEREV